MVTSVLPVSNIVNVTITNTPSGLIERNINSLALFTEETPSNLDPYGIYISPAQVADDYGTSSKTALMANAVFAQVPNLRSGNGRLVIIPMLSAVSATPGVFTSANLSANLASIIAVDDGDLRVTVNSANYDLTGLDFTGATTWAEIVKILQNRLVEVIVDPDANGFNMTSKKVGTASTVALAAVPGGTGTNLAAAGYFNAAGGTPVAGANATGETLLQAIARTETEVSYVPVMSTLDLEDTAVLANSNGIEAMDRMYLQHFASIQDIAGIITTIKNAENHKTRCLLYTDSMASANLMKSAYAGRAFSVNFNGSNTAITMNLKSLKTITPDANITQTNYANANIAGADLYVSYDGVPSVYSTEGNDFFDNIYMNLALKFGLETAGFNYLRQTNTKVPQTEQGMNGLKSAYSQVLERFIRNGCIAAGGWNSSETFGDPEIFVNNIETRGYYIYSIPIIDQNSTEREQRKAPLIQIAVKRSGAIHTSDVIVLVND